MSLAVLWTGPGADPARPFYLCVKHPQDAPPTDEWCEEEADKFTSEQSARAILAKLPVNPAQILIIPYPAGLTPPRAAFSAPIRAGRRPPPRAFV
jgi:hypothetical protein